MTNQYVNPVEIKKAIEVLTMNNPFECRIIRNDKKRPLSGYFNNYEDLLTLLERQDLRNSNVYITLQALNPAVCSKFQYCKLLENQSATSDSEVVAYNWLFVDLDPERISGVSSSSSELLAAAELAKKVNEFMQKLGFKAPVKAESGNGCHLLYKVDLPNTEENKNLLHRCLETLSLLFDNDRVKIDTVNFNPSRICKLYGTVAQKGQHTEERPHRMAIMKNAAGEKIEVTDNGVLKKLAALYPVSEPAPRYNGYQQREEFDVESFLRDHSISYKLQNYNGGVKYVLESCPFDSSHKAPDSAVFKASDGRLGFKCLHNSCAGYDWKAFRKLLDPDAYERKERYQQKNSRDYGELYLQHRQNATPEVEPAPVPVSLNELINYPNAIGKAQTIIVSNGEENAQAVMNVGGNAIGIRELTDIGILLEAIKQNTDHNFVLAFSRKEEWKEFEKQLKELLKNSEKLLEHVYSINLAGHMDEISNFFKQAPEKFKENVQKAMQNPALEEYAALSDKNALMDYYNEILNPERGKFYPTGFAELDKELGGGLYAGLYALGAISSLGKTTLCLQIANNLAKQGIDVLFFSLEMSRTELIAKSISRLSAFYCMDKYQNTTHALTQRQVMSGYAYNKYSDAQREALFASCEEFEQFSPFLYTVEGNFDFSVEQLQRRIERHIEATGRRPVVFVDYLQILDFEGEIQGKKNYTDKQKTDMQVKTLKRISRDCNVPVVVISSFNRESYTQPVSMTSFKESGGIEYSCDVLLGMQYKGMDYDSSRDGNLEDKKAKSSRYKYIMELIRNINGSLKAGLPAPVQVKILKNRNGARGQSVYLDFFPRFNLYTRAGKGAVAQKDWEALAPFHYNPEFDNKVKQHFKNGASKTEYENLPLGDGAFEVVSKQEGGEQ